MKKNKDSPPIQTLNDKTPVYSIDATERKYLLVYTDADKKLKPKLMTRAEFHQLGGIIGLYHKDATGPYGFKGQFK